MCGLRKDNGCRTLNTPKQRAYEIFEGTTSDVFSRSFQIFMVALISVNVLVVIIETEDVVAEQFKHFFYPFEVISVTIFTIEYIGRILVCSSDPKYQGKKLARVRFILTPMMLVDLLAILPFFLPFFVTDLRFIRIIRLFRLFRLFKLARYSEPLQTLGEVLKAKSGDLAVSFFVLFIVLIFASSLMYYVEHEAQPESFSSIPASMWWGVITLTTIGYGDAYPVTTAGKVLAAGIAILGIAVYAIPTGIMASAFSEQIHKKRREKNTCPHCGKAIE